MSAAFVGVSDIVMMQSITDIAGLNRISRVVLGQCRLRDRRHGAGDRRRGGRQAGDRPDHVRRHHSLRDRAADGQLKADYDCLVFHATGTGGRAMEKLVDSGLIVGVIDVTTTEICDLLFGGVLSAPARTGSAPSRAPAFPMSARSARSTW